MHNSDINNTIDLINFIKRFREIVVLNSTMHCILYRPTLVILYKYKQSTNMLQNLEICFIFVYYSSDGNLVIYHG